MDIFQFKQFAVDQTGCAMKVNTDGVLLGALAGAELPKAILDIGAGTGVIALMLAQRFADAQVDAVEIDENASITAANNFRESPFADRVSLFPNSFQEFFKNHPLKQYDLIVSNPPFHLNSLQSTGKAKTLARHTGEDFFVELMTLMPQHLTANGKLTLVLPQQTATLVKELALNVGLYLQNIIEVQSFAHSEPHRQVITFVNDELPVTKSNIIIYSSPQNYTAQYRTVLSNFLTIF